MGSSLYQPLMMTFEIFSRKFNGSFKHFGRIEANVDHAQPPHKLGHPLTLLLDFKELHHSQSCQKNEREHQTVARLQNCKWQYVHCLYFHWNNSQYLNSIEIGSKTPGKDDTPKYSDCPGCDARGACQI
jgi:hypothetical protein